MKIFPKFKRPGAWFLAPFVLLPAFSLAAGLSPVHVVQTESEVEQERRQIEAFEEERRLIEAFEAERRLIDEFEAGRTPARETSPSVIDMPLGSSSSAAPGQMDTDVEASLTSGLNHYRNRRYADALREFTSVANVQPHRADVLYLMGYCYYMMGEFQESMDAFNRSAENDPAFDPRSIYQKP